MAIEFFDDVFHISLRPLTSTMPACMIRTGISTVEEKWKHFLPDADTGYRTAKYLAEKFKPIETEEERLFINGRAFPDEDLVEAVSQLPAGASLTKGETIIAHRGGKDDLALTEKLEVEITGQTSGKAYTGEVYFLEFPHDVFAQNERELKRDFDRITAGGKSAKLSSGNTLIGDRIFAEEGAVVTASVLNSETGPIYIGKNAEIMEGCMVRGPVALLDNAVLKMGAKIYGASTFGKYVKAGGEVNNSVIFDYSNKGHDGFLGNSVISSWCNLGADTNNSNLKNNYGNVKVWNYRDEKATDTGRQFYGLIMGEHSKTGINTMLNTGTVTGVAANVFGSGFPPKFIPDFSWGGAGGFATHKLEKALESADRMMERRGRKLTAEDRDILTSIFEQTAGYRT